MPTPAIPAEPLDETRLRHLSREELARLLAAHRRGTPSWRRIQAECARRSERWTMVMRLAWCGMLGVAALGAVVSLLR